MFAELPIDHGEDHESGRNVRMIGTRHAFKYPERALRERKRLPVLPQYAIQLCEFSEAYCYLPMVRSERLLFDRKRALHRLNRFCIPVDSGVKEADFVPGLSNLRVISTQKFLADAERALTCCECARVIALGLKCKRNDAKASSNVGMLRTKYLFSNRQSAPRFVQPGLWLRQEY